jgi:hypothetical protein
MTFIYTGIDPGEKGAICHIYDDTIQFYDLPYSESEICPWQLRILLAPSSSILVETQHGRKGFGMKGIMSSMENFGVIKAISKIRTQKCFFIHPSVWKKEMGVTKDKETSIKKALELYPKADLKRKRTISDGRAEALLLAHYLRENFLELNKQLQ